MRFVTLFGCNTDKTDFTMSDTRMRQECPHMAHVWCLSSPILVTVRFWLPHIVHFFRARGRTMAIRWRLVVPPHMPSASNRIAVARQSLLTGHVLQCLSAGELLGTVPCSGKNSFFSQSVKSRHLALSRHWGSIRYFFVTTSFPACHCLVSSHDSQNP